MDVGGATVVPGLIDSHTHVLALGTIRSQVNLIDVPTAEEAVEQVAAAAANIPDGEWIIGRGWDEGAWASNYPTMELLSEKVPNHPVLLDGLHSYAAWGNRMAFERAGITKDTPSPEGGEILKDAGGNPTGILVNRAADLLRSVVPETTDEQLKTYFKTGLDTMAGDGYVAIHEAGITTQHMKALEALKAEGNLPIRFYVMLAAREPAVCREWLEKGPDKGTAGLLTVRSVKVFYDGALGSRGARMLEDYSDTPGHRGVSGEEFGFDEALVKDMMNGGFQICVHAIGDEANRETLDFFESVFEENPTTRRERHRIEHAQVVHPDDMARFAELDIIASMEPPHAPEDKGWAEDRVGPERIKGAYAWRTLREAGARLAFNSDLVGTDHNIFYGLHSAITRRDKNLEPAGGWYPEQSMTPEEALRGYTIWGAYTAFMENETGILAPGRWADITVMSIDPLVVGETDPGKLFEGEIVATIVDGKVVYEAQ
jgi:predicted amidohydrolase YtcJ